MFDSGFELISKEEHQIFLQLFQDKSKENAILFTDFRDLITSFSKFESPCLIDIIEKLRKKLKEKMIGFNDNELSIGK
jgi:hypothetical protein